MSFKLFPQTSPDSLLRKINPSIGPVCRTKWEKGHVERNRRIYDYELVFFGSGSGRVLAGDRVFFCKSGSMIIIPPALPHCTISDTQTERWCIHFDWFGDCTAHLSETPVFVYTEEELPFVETETAQPPPENVGLDFPLCCELAQTELGKFRHLLQEFFLTDTETPGGELMRQGIFLTILGNVLTFASGGHISARIRNSRFLAAKNIIDSNFTDSGMNCADVAEKIGMSVNHLAKLFCSMTGLTTMEYLTMRRMERARELLLNTQEGIAEIMEQCGFSDANYFSRYFRKKHGMSPTQFRESASEIKEDNAQ